MHTDIFEEVWKPHEIIYKELWYPLQQATKEYPSEDYPFHRITIGLLPVRVVKQSVLKNTLTYYSHFVRVVSQNVQAHIASYEYEG